MFNTLCAFTYEIVSNSAYLDIDDRQTPPPKSAHPKKNSFAYVSKDSESKKKFFFVGSFSKKLRVTTQLPITKYMLSLKIAINTLLLSISDGKL